MKSVDFIYFPYIFIDFYHSDWFFAGLYTFAIKMIAS